MRLEATTLHHVSTVLRDRTLTIRWQDLGGGVIVLGGGNGAAKTHMLEASGPASFFGEWPYYGERFVAHVPVGVRDARLENTFRLGGRRFAIKWDGDRVANKGRGEQSPTLAELDELGHVIGTPHCGTGEFKAAIAALLPPKEFLYVANYGAQASPDSPPGFCGLDKAARRDLVIRMLGAARWQARSLRAKELGDAADAQLQGTRQRIAALRPQVDRLAALAPLLDEATTRLRGAEAALSEADRAAQAATADLADAQAYLRQIEERTQATLERNAERATRRATIAAKRESAERQLAALDSLLAEEATIRDAAERLRTLETGALPAQRDMVAQRLTALQAAEAEQRVLTERITQLRAAYAALKRQIPATHADQAVPAAAEVSELIATLTAAARDAAAAVEQLTAAQAELDRAAGAEQEALTERRLLEQERADLVARSARLATLEEPDSPICGRCAFSQDARNASARIAAIDERLALLPVKPAPGQIAPAQGAADENRQRWAATADAHRAAERDLTVAHLWTQLAANVAEGRQALQASTAADATVTEQQAAHRVAVEALADLERTHAHLVEIAGDLPALVGATTDAAHLRGQLDALVTDEAAVGPDEDVPILDDAAAGVATLMRHADAAATGRRAAEEARIAAQRDFDRLVGERDAIAPCTAQLDAMEAEEAAQVRTLGRCRVLQKACGRDGIQAVLIDRAGPEVSAIINELLRRCYGGRFAVEFTTTKDRSDGKGVLEVFDLVITDAEQDGAEVKKGSGGEQVIIDEAIRLGFAIYNATKSGVRIETLWRDESGAALSPIQARRWIAMLRAAREIGGFHQIIVVSHTPAVWAAADVVLWLSQGTVTITDGAGALQLATEGGMALPPELSEAA